jgi:hypothetical protein
MNPELYADVRKQVSRDAAKTLGFFFGVVPLAIFVVVGLAIIF